MATRTKKVKLLRRPAFQWETDHLTVPGWLHQISPTLQTGIISAVHPFPCPTPHGFTINVMVQGGASGSPVFSQETGEVLGLVYAGIYDFHTSNDQNTQRTPTNYTYAVPAHFIVNALPQISQNQDFLKTQSTAKSIRQVISERTAINTFSGLQVKDVKLPW